MVFANLPNHEKSAFFSLLDEYFASRPEIFANSSGPSASSTTEDALHTTGATAASAVHRALASNPEATSKLISAGLKHGVPKSSPYAAATSDPGFRDATSRVAAASLAFSASNNSFGQKQPPQAPPHRSPSTVSSKFGADKTDSESRSPNANVVTPRTDVSSARSMFESMRHPFSNPEPSSISSPFGTKKNAFTPPPARRVPSGAAPTPPPPRRQTPQEQEQEEEEEEEEVQGEWAEALYDYTSAESTDLELQANQRVLITEKTSDDWWTGEIDGRKGLFPAAYVKIL